MNTRAGAITYSTVVVWMKIILPLLAIGVLSTLFLFAGRPNPEDAIIVSGDISQLAVGQQMGQPRFSSVLDGGQALQFTAARAAPLANSTDLFTAEDISVRLTLAPGLEALVDADGAIVDMDAQLAELSGDVILRRTDGLRLRTPELSLGLASLFAESGAVEITGPGLNLEAERMEVSADQQIHFAGSVRVLYQP